MDEDGGTQQQQMLRIEGGRATKYVVLTPSFSRCACRVRPTTETKGLRFSQSIISCPPQLRTAKELPLAVANGTSESDGVKKIVAFKTAHAALKA